MVWCRCSFLRIWVILFFKQKTAYEMRISDWSSDVCSSDLIETVAIDKTAMIAIGGADQKIDRTAFGNLDALYLDIAGDVARGVRAGRFEAQNFFDHGRDHAGDRKSVV